jgi:phage-related tail fiber protein
MSETKQLQGIWTQYGRKKIAAWARGGDALTIRSGALGDGGGEVPQVNPAQTELVGEVWRGVVNSVQLDPKDATIIIVDLIVPHDVGNFEVREWGLFDEQDFLVAVGPHSEMHKPVIASGQAAEFIERFFLPVSNSGAITLVIGSQATATQEFVIQKIMESVVVCGFSMSPDGELVLTVAEEGDTLNADDYQSLHIVPASLVWTLDNRKHLIATLDRRVS